MSSITDALEAEVAAIGRLRARPDDAADAQRCRAAVDRHFARLLRLIAPRIRHFTRAYGLTDHADDAAQACAVGLLRAIDAYDPAKARFTTFVNWQLRGELQSLRFRLRTDMREPARRVGAQTVSLDAVLADDVARMLDMADDEALEKTEALAAETLARRACGTLLDEHFAQMRRMAMREGERRARPRGREFVKPGTIVPQEIDRIEARIRLERDIAQAHLLGDSEILDDSGLTGEQRRQVARRTVRALTERARGNPRYDPDALASEMLALPLSLAVSLRRH